MRAAGFGEVRYEERLLGTMGINIGRGPRPSTLALDSV